jgi:hypothetical protein
MITVVDSWWEPNAAQIVQAKGQSVDGWCGYFDGPGIYHGWADATFQRILAAGLKTGAYCSYRADPLAMKARAAALGIPIFLDVERSVDGGDGPAVDPWLNASGAALYGNGPRYGAGNPIQDHLSHGHAGYILSDGSLGNQNRSWPAQDPRPPQPCGWQYRNGVQTSFGTVDFCHFDEALFAVTPPPPSRRTEMLIMFLARGVDGNVGVFISNGIHFKHVENDVQYNDYINLTGPFFNGGAPVKYWGGPVGDVGAFGVPADAVSATLLGLPFGSGTTPPAPPSHTHDVTASANIAGTTGPPQ